MILIIDNYDSFVHNLARYIQQLCSQEIIVARNDQLNSKFLLRSDISAIVVSPGPRGPAQAGGCIELVKNRLQDVPILGVCLGHQIIIEALGGRVLVSDNPMHGKSCLVHHQGNSRLFQDVASPFRAGRYHSLFAENQTMPAALKIIATSDDGTVMAVEHDSLPVFGVQFHPESVLTEHGYRLLFNFLAIANLNPVFSNSLRIFA